MACRGFVLCDQWCRIDPKGRAPLMPRPQIDRRSVLRGALATGTLFGLDALFTADRTDAAAVGPNDAIKVTKVEAFVLKNSWVFVKISTDAGIVGWGEMLKDDAKACA